jgi:hypothetical protein
VVCGSFTFDAGVMTAAELRGDRVHALEGDRLLA